jgi:hypothetical protein
MNSDSNADQVYVSGDNIHVVSPEGSAATMPLETLFARIGGPLMDTGNVVLPDGIKAVLSRGPVTIWVHERPPQVYSFKWIADRSARPCGPGTEYRIVRLALPYLIVFAVFNTGGNGHAALTHSNECFFRTGPLTSLDDELFFPCLLNVSKFTPPDGRSLAWICTANMAGDYGREPDPNRRMRAAFTALMHCLLESGFNRSSEVHEGKSYYGESRPVDPRLATVDAWQAASEADPLFVLQVPWLKTGLTVRQLAERIWRNLKASAQRPSSESALARLVFNWKRGR